MLKIIVIVVAIALAALLAFATTKPDTFHVQRSASIKAPPDKIFPFINDFHRWSAWSPWEKMDPAMKRTYSGPAAGQGTAYAWEGNSKVGAGRMQIAESQPPSKITVQLDFLKPMEGHNIAEFTLEAQGDSTTVTWAMHGPAPYLSKLMQVFFSMDSLVGKDFATGLANLKSVAEQPTP
ncbi:MAG TPA: SRPBCC family protein [Rhizobacter sp.]|nr:SRPBCC family protein [Rhizobacter sp.]